MNAELDFFFATQVYENSNILFLSVMQRNARGPKLGPRESFENEHIDEYRVSLERKEKTFTVDWANVEPGNESLVEALQSHSC